MIAKEDRHGGRNEREEKRQQKLKGHMMKMKTEKALNFLTVLKLEIIFFDTLYVKEINSR